MLRMSELIAGVSRDGAAAVLGKLALVDAGLALEEGAEGNGLARLEEMLALEGVFLIDEAADLVDAAGSPLEVDSAWVSWLWFALAAASVDLGCRMALAAFDAFADLDDLAEGIVDVER